MLVTELESYDATWCVLQKYNYCDTDKNMKSKKVFSPTTNNKYEKSLL